MNANTVQNRHYKRWLVRVEFADVISLIGVNKEKGNCNVGYWLGTPYWNKGICTKAISEVIKFAFNNLSLKEIWAECLVENTPSIKVLKKNGFLKENEFTFDDGKFEGEKGVWYVQKRISISYFIKLLLN